MESFQAIERINSTPNLSSVHFEDGTIKLSNVMEEVNYLKTQITNIRQDMADFLTGLASISPGSKPTQVFEENIRRVNSLQKTLDDYVERYKKLDPLMELVQKELGTSVPDRQEPSIKPPMMATTASSSTLSITKKQPRKRSYTKKNSAATPHSGFTPATIPEVDGSESQPILL